MAGTIPDLLDLLGERDVHRDLVADVVKGLTAETRSLPPKWFYDARGSELFEQITRTPEYYPTEAERGLLLGHAPAILAASGADTLVELGSGVSDKTTALLDALEAAGGRDYLPFDVSRDALTWAIEQLQPRYPELNIAGVVGDFDQHLGQIPVVGRRMIAFLGGTVGNYAPEPRQKLLGDIVSTMQPGDTFLLGTDLVKDAARLEAAYNDAQGITAAFNKNVLVVLNRELKADFDLDAWEHWAYWDTDNEWISIHVRALSDQTVTLPGLLRANSGAAPVPAETGDDTEDLVVSFAAGETIHTEISAKFTLERLTNDLGLAGLELIETWTDGDFMVSLSRR